MAQTHLSLFVHLVFHTEGNRLSIKEEWRTQLHAYLGGCIRTAGCVPLAVGGTHDHVHVLIGFRSIHVLADVVRDIKVASSKWVHQEIGQRLFGWQGGYGAFTVSPFQIENVKNYIANQMQHHQVRSAKDEYVEMLDAAGVEYDAQYLWKYRVAPPGLGIILGALPATLRHRANFRSPFRAKREKWNVEYAAFGLHSYHCGGHDLGLFFAGGL